MSHRSRLSGVRVLVVDDARYVLDVVTDMLQCNGANVTAVDSAEEALDILQRERPDVLLSDIAMPGMDGYALLRQARARLRGARVVAAALTAYAGEEDRRRALAAGFQMHLAKPVEPAELISVIATLIAQSSKALL